MQRFQSKPSDLTKTAGVLESNRLWISGPFHSKWSWLGSVTCEQVTAVQLWLVSSYCCTAVLIYKDHKGALGRRPERFSSASVRSIALGPCNTGRPQVLTAARASLLLYLNGGADMLSRVHHSLGFGMQQSNSISSSKYTAKKSMTAGSVRLKPPSCTALVLDMWGSPRWHLD